MSTTACPCGSQRLLNECCGQYLYTETDAPTAEALMRSRYTAFALKNIPYILSTVPSEYPQNEQEINDWAFTCEFVKLQVIRKQQGKSSHRKGVVEYIASFIENGKAQELHEVAHFRQVNKQWFYIPYE